MEPTTISPTIHDGLWLLAFLVVADRRDAKGICAWNVSLRNLWAWT